MTNDVAACNIQGSGVFHGTAMDDEASMIAAVEQYEMSQANQHS